MGDLERRLERLEARQNGTGAGGERRSPPEFYDWMREEARQDIEESLADGEDPLYRIAENGDVQYRDGRPINDYRDFILALDERIAELEREIAEEEA